MQKYQEPVTDILINAVVGVATFASYFLPFLALIVAAVVVDWYRTRKALRTWR